MFSTAGTCDPFESVPTPSITPTEPLSGLFLGGFFGKKQYLHRLCAFESSSKTAAWVLTGIDWMQRDEHFFFCPLNANVSLLPSTITINDVKFTILVRQQSQGRINLKTVFNITKVTSMCRMYRTNIDQTVQSEHCSTLWCSVWVRRYPFLHWTWITLDPCCTSKG